MEHQVTTRRRRTRPAPQIAADPITGARTFLETQTSAMRQWDNAALPNRREHETALAYIAALLRLLAPETSEATP